MQIRNASREDADAVSALLGELEFPSSPEEVRERLKAMSSAALVAVANGKIVGLITTSVMSVLHRPKPVGRISALVVSSSERGNGVGRALVVAAETMLERAGCGLVEVTSNFRLESAHLFYKSIGYEATSFRFKRDFGKAQPAVAADGHAPGCSSVGKSSLWHGRG